MSADHLTSPSNVSLSSFFRQRGNAPAGAGRGEEEDACTEGLGGSVSVEGDVPLPPVSFGPRLLAVSQTLQPQLGEEETVSWTGEWRNINFLTVKVTFILINNNLFDLYQ